MDERYVLQVYVGSLSRLYEALSIEASKTTTADEIVECICEKLTLNDGAGFYELAEVMGNQGGQDCKERRIGHHECPVALQLLWPKKSSDKNTGGHTDFKFCLRRKLMGNLWSLSMADSNDSQLIRDYFLRFLYQPRNCEYPDLCQLPDLTEQTLLENLKVSLCLPPIMTWIYCLFVYYTSLPDLALYALSRIHFYIIVVSCVSLFLYVLLQLFSETPLVSRLTFFCISCPIYTDNFYIGSQSITFFNV